MQHAATNDNELVEHQDLFEVCLDYLGTKQIVLWSRAFDLSQQGSRQQAAEWLANEISAVFAQ